MFRAKFKIDEMSENLGDTHLEAGVKTGVCADMSCHCQAQKFPVNLACVHGVPSGSTQIYPKHWIVCVYHNSRTLAGVSNLQPAGRLHPWMAMNAARHKIIHLLKTLLDFFLWLCVTMYLMCALRQLFFFQCDSEHQRVAHPCLVL